MLNETTSGPSAVNVGRETSHKLHEMGLPGSCAGVGWGLQPAAPSPPRLAFGNRPVGALAQRWENVAWGLQKGRSVSGESHGQAGSAIRVSEGSAFNTLLIFP